MSYFVKKDCYCCEPDAKWTPSIIQDHEDSRPGHIQWMCALYRTSVLHLSAQPQLVYRAVYVDWKLQNNCEKRSFSETRAS